MNATSHPGEIELRAASLCDAAALADLRLAFMRLVKTGGLADEDEFRAWYASYVGRSLARETTLAWLCLAAGSPCGTVELRLKPVRTRKAADNSAPRLEGYVSGLYVDPAFRGRGLARTLMQRLIATSRARGLLRLALHAYPDAEPLYVSLGFRPFRRLMVLRLDEPGSARGAMVHKT